MSDNLNSALQRVIENTHSDAADKLLAGLSSLKSAFSSQQFFYLFAICPRWFGKGTPEENTDLIPFDHYGVLHNWSNAQLARLFVLSTLAQTVDKQSYKKNINELFKTADLNEMVLLVHALSFLPEPEAFVERAREAARSNIESVFCALAHNSNYASKYFDLAGWNQLVLKAAFLAVPIWSMVGLRERNNTELVTMLKNYAIERQAAARTVPWDLFCCPGWLASSEPELEFLVQQHARGTNKIKAAISMALSENTHREAKKLAATLAPQQKISWQDIATLENE
ncbi:hypothetical protein SAMN02745866_01276 [Alteromonadaceae bacterium Bs31]|nr:hypothetical protein SAMN02745866_01276 [Alteromonadaceae bacterium Bs31]